MSPPIDRAVPSHRLKKHVRVKHRDGYRELGPIRRRPSSGVPGFTAGLERSGQEKTPSANPCAGVEFPVAIRGLFRPHYVTWSEQQQIEFHAPDYFRNVVRIITETGLRVYKELAPMRKDQVDLENAFVWIPDSKTPNGVAEVPLSPLLRKHFGISW